MDSPKVAFIREQSLATRELTLKILRETPFEIWYETPPIIESNIAWQVGHLIVSEYYHSIAVISGPNWDIFKEVLLTAYFPIYSMMTKSTSNEIQPKPETLLRELEIINNYATSQFDTLKDADLDNLLEPTKMKHPIAKTKYEALTWSFRHEMWHLGQISTLKRVLGYSTSW